ncbi:MAG: hypothetical protein CML66_14155 [Rhodobacteraceae bacterium]|nr:hypothetical protein [Paracoccaceae bacterium]MAY45417.1 hypothetical protein [Paracoccaceae bacterium]
MGRYIVVLVTIIALLAIVVGYIRLAPSDPADWHEMPDFSADADLSGAVMRVVDTGPDGLGRLANVALATPRTTRLAGSVEEGMMTFVTRSKLWGFPDYTTARQDGDLLKIYGRLRFGRSDLGVNRARVDGWIAGL